MTASAFWTTSRFALDLSQPKVMGIVNITPDSFSDGGNAAASSALAHAEQLLSDGADLLDLGAESTRPGAAPVPGEVELQRLLPVLREAVKLGVPISVDTYKPAVMRAALDAGADIINDVWGFRQPGALDVVAVHPSCGLVVMHMHGEPQTMQVLPMQGEASAQVLLFLEQSIEEILRQMGKNTPNLQIQNRICLDCGIGFGKTVAQNFELLQNQAALLTLGYPLLAGWSRKSSLGAVTGLAVHDRMIPSVAAALLAVERGARVLRVHDVRETVQALKVWQAATA